jgi:hypothetical protein
LATRGAGKRAAVSSVLETGEIFFFYRPRVGTTEVDKLEDVQRFFVVMKPDRRRRFRRIVVGAKKLPDPRAHERVWAFVAEVADSPDELRDDLEATTYETRTRGIRVQPEARPVGEGRYAIADHDGHTHLVYVLELPPEPGPAQDAFNIRKDASYIVAVRNPEAPAPPGAGLDPRRRAAFPQELLDLFGGRRFIAVERPGLLDYEGAELVVIGAAEDAKGELGIELDPEQEALHDADIWRQLRLRPGELPVEPLTGGELR